MKSLSIAVVFLTLMLLQTVGNEAFTPSALLHVFKKRTFSTNGGRQGTRGNTHQSKSNSDDETSSSESARDSEVSPQPPGSEPPEMLLRENLFFAQPCDPKIDDECDTGETNGVSTDSISNDAAMLGETVSQVFGNITVSLCHIL